MQWWSWLWEISPFAQGVRGTGIALDGTPSDLSRRQDLGADGNGVAADLEDGDVVLLAEGGGGGGNVLGEDRREGHLHDQCQG